MTRPARLRPIVKSIEPFGDRQCAGGSTSRQGGTACRHVGTGAVRCHQAPQRRSDRIILFEFGSVASRLARQKRDRRGAGWKGTHLCFPPRPFLAVRTLRLVPESLGVFSHGLDRAAQATNANDRRDRGACNRANPRGCDCHSRDRDSRARIGKRADHQSTNSADTGYSAQRMYPRSTKYR
jgi:hypothetical protein